MSDTPTNDKLALELSTANPNDNRLVQPRIDLPDSIIEKLALNGDVSGLKPPEKVAYYRALCARVGLDPSTQPFKLLRLSGREVFYCDRGGAAQLNRLHGVSHTILNREVQNDCYVVTVRASANGRHLDSLGAVPIGGLKGEALCNAMMKGETKGKRRATLDLLGLGMLDETEVGAIPGAEPAPQPVPPPTPERFETMRKVTEEYIPGEVEVSASEWDKAAPASNLAHFAGPQNRPLPLENSMAPSILPSTTPAKPVQNAPRTSEGIQTAPTPEKPVSEPPGEVSKAITERLWSVLEMLKAREGEPNRQLVTDFLRAAGVIRQDQEPENFPVRWLPYRKPSHIRDLGFALANFKAGEPAQMPYPPNEFNASVAPVASPVGRVATSTAGPVARTSGSTPDTGSAILSAGSSRTPSAGVVRHGECTEEHKSESDSGEKLSGQHRQHSSTWQNVPVPYGPIKGTALGQLPPDVQFDLWNTFSVSVTKGPDGKPQDLPVDRKFRTALDEMGKEKNFTKSP